LNSQRIGELKSWCRPSLLVRDSLILSTLSHRYLRDLKAIMLVVDKDTSLTVTGNGDVIEPSNGIMAIGDREGLTLLLQHERFTTFLSSMLCK